MFLEVVGVEVVAAVVMLVPFAPPGRSTPPVRLTSMASVPVTPKMLGDSTFTP